MSIVSSGSGHPNPVKSGFGSSKAQIRRAVSSLRVQGRNNWSSFGLNVESSRVQTRKRQIRNRYIPDPGFFEKNWYSVIEALPGFFKSLFSSENETKSRRIACQPVQGKESEKDQWIEEVGSKLENQGWGNLLQERGRVNESQFMEFYSSLEVEKTENGGFAGEFNIGGKTHGFTDLDVARLMGVPCAGYDTYIPDETSNEHEFLHHIVTRSVLPRDENLEVNLVMDSVIIEHLMEDKKVNLPSLMMQHMKYCKMSKWKALPYPGLVKKLLVDARVYEEEGEKAFEIWLYGSWTDSKNQR